MTGALISASVALVVAVSSQFVAWWRVRSDRLYERRRLALLDVQDAALALRAALRSYGRQMATEMETAHAISSGPTPSAGGRLLDVATMTDGVDEAQGRLDVCVARLEERALSRTAAEAVATWQESAREHFISPGDETAGRENECWGGVNRAVAAALAV